MEASHKGIVVGQAVRRMKTVKQWEWRGGRNARNDCLSGDKSKGNPSVVNLENRRDSLPQSFPKEYLVFIGPLRWDGGALQGFSPRSNK